MEVPLYVVAAVLLQLQKGKTNKFANSIDPNEMIHTELSDQDLHCLPYTGL